MKTRILTPLVLLLMLASCTKNTIQDKVEGTGDALDRIEKLYADNQFRDALAVCDSMLQDDTYRVDTLSTEENNHRYIVIMRNRIMILGYLSRQDEAVSDMKTLADFCNSNEDDEENFYSSVAAQMNVKIGLAEIDMGRTDDGFATIDKGIDAMRDKTSKNARMATVNFMHNKAKALDAQNRADEAIVLSEEALGRMQHYRELYAESFAKQEDMDVMGFCNYYEGNFYSFLANVYRRKAERGVAEAADSVRFYFDKAMSIPRFSDDPVSNTMLVGVFCFLDMPEEFDVAYRQIEGEFAKDTLAYFYIDVQRYAAEMAHRHGDNARALAIMQRVYHLQTMRIKDDSMKRVAEAANAYEMAQMQREQQEMEISRLKWIIMAVCLGFVALAVCIVLLYFYLRGRRTYRRYTTIIAAHDTNEMVIRALKMDPATSMDYLLTLTGESAAEELERRFELSNGMSLDKFRARLQQDEAEDDAAMGNNVENVAHERDAFLEKLDNVLLTDNRLFLQDILRKDIARDMDMPMIHVLEHLKEFTGCTLTAYISQKRIEHAAHLLLTTEDKVETICYSCGFNSIATFYRLFTKQYGCPPAEYRAGKS